MYIKQVVMKNCKSFGDYKEVRFHKNYNVVFGRDGSGKTSLLNAILSAIPGELPEEWNPINEHEDKRISSSALIEVTFDITKEGSQDSSELRIRRNWARGQGARYFVNEKEMTSKMVTENLKAIGVPDCTFLSILKQGQVSCTARASCSQVLELVLKLVAKPTIIERKAQLERDLKIIRDQLQEVIVFEAVFEQKLADLTTNDDIIPNYIYWRKVYQAIQSIWLGKTGEDAKSKLREVQECFKKCLEIEGPLAGAHAEVQNQLHKASETVSEAKKYAHSNELKALEAIIPTLVSEMTFAKSMVQQLKSCCADSTRKQTSYQEQRKNLTKEIQKEGVKLKKFMSKYELLQKREQTINKELALKNQMKLNLLRKGNRGNMFSNKENRDQQLQLELEKINKTILVETERKEQLVFDLQARTNRYVELEKEIVAMVKETELWIMASSNTIIDSFNISVKKDLLTAQKTKLWKTQTILKLDILDQEREKQHLLSFADKNTLTGIRVVQTVLKMLKEESAMSADLNMPLLIETFTCEEIYYKAVEMVVRKKLFSYVIDKTEVGQNILKTILEKKLPGSVDFFALDHVLSEEPFIPERLPEGVTPLIEKLSFDSRYDNIMKFVFGNTLLCPDGQTAVKISEQHKVSCVTLSGFMVSPDSIIVGEHHFGEAMKAAHRILDNHLKRSSMEDELTKSEREMKIIEAQIVSVDSELNEMKKPLHDDQLQKIIPMYEELFKQWKSKMHTEDLLAACTVKLELNQIEKEGQSVELLEELIGEMTLEDGQTVNRLDSEISGIQPETQNERKSLEEKIHDQMRLLGNLQCKHFQITSSLFEIQEIQKHFDYFKNKLAGCEASLKSAMADVEALESKVAAATSKLTQLVDHVKDLQQREKFLQGELVTSLRLHYEYLTRENDLHRFLETGQFILQHLDQPPSPEHVQEYGSMDIPTLSKKMHEAEENVNKYGNHRKIDDYDFTLHEKYGCRLRKEEIQRIELGLQGKLKDIEKEDFEEFQKVFHKLAACFREVFQKLVPGGDAKLTISSRGETPPVSIADYTKVRIIASFDSNVEREMKNFQELSNPKKHMLALSLFFAASKCFPAPFYIYDEIDLGLTPTFRQSVAKYLNELSKTAQVIQATSMREAVECADKFLRITTRNFNCKISYPGRRQALQFFANRD